MQPKRDLCTHTHVHACTMYRYTCTCITSPKSTDFLSPCAHSTHSSRQTTLRGPTCYSTHRLKRMTSWDGPYSNYKHNGGVARLMLVRAPQELRELSAELLCRANSREGSGWSVRARLGWSQNGGNMRSHSCICPRPHAPGFERAFSNTCSYPVSNVFTPRFECVYASFRMCLQHILNAFTPHFEHS